jgi:hypothetical protein
VQSTLTARLSRPIGPSRAAILRTGYQISNVELTRISARRCSTPRGDWPEKGPDWGLVGA